MTWFRHRLTRLSWIKFIWRRLAGNRIGAHLQLKSGTHVLLRPKPFQDIDIATEIFATEIYEFPVPIERENVKRIVDLGANVGYSLVHWLERFPNARIIAFEPHPGHVKQIKKHLALNRMTDRVTLIEKAAGTRAGKLYLTDDEYCSAVRDAPAHNTLEVEVCDWIAEVGNAPIDLLKMDIEGSEYTLLEDKRFGQLSIKTGIMEWHDTPEYPHGHDWCEKKLREYGYTVLEGRGNTSASGLLWAYAPETTIHNDEN